MNTKRKTALILTSFLIGFSLVSNAAVIFTDPGFAGEFTTVGDPFDENDSANFDKWVSQGGATDPGSLVREWTMVATGGNPGGYADGTFGNGTNYRRTMLQAVTDDKANTGLLNLNFDLNLVNAEGGTESVVVGVWGVQTLSGATFSFDTAPGPTFGSNTEDAISLATQTFTTDTSGWEQQTISNINLGTGYDLVIVAFQSNNFSWDSTVGIDNVSLVPEPSTLALLGLAGLAAITFRRRK